MPRTVLIVDDNGINRQLLMAILSPEYTPLVAENGQEAMELLSSGRQSISAVLLDIVMPVLDGYGVLKQIQAQPLLSQIPVIIITGDAGVDTEKRALALGATDFVRKPFDGDVIKRRLNNLIKLRETAAMVNSLQRDRLTGLWNRETFFERAAWLIAKKPAGYFVLSSVDIDNFKVINDQYGMEKGDAVLKNLARVLVRECGGEDCLCGRVSADNFVVLYPRSQMPATLEAQRQRETLVQDTVLTPLTVSTGRYIVSDKRISVSAMYDRAVIAQTAVKGRYDVHVAQYDESMRSHLIREQEIVNEMGAALTGGQFQAWFQPQYNHATGARVGAEALVRWLHPERGLVSPGEFIPVFEKNGFVYELDKYVWEQACICLRRWTDEGRKPLPVSVNISRYDLFRADLSEKLLGLVEKYRIPVSLLRLEITESAFAESTEHVVGVVKQLIGHGFTVEIDDFGSGYSSLNTLKDVPAQILKLDMRFLETDTCAVDDTCDDSASRGGNILESVVRMAKWLGMAVIAEGVETKEQADYLKSVGCNYVQGYLYAKPMPMKRYEALAAQVDREEKLIVMETVDNFDNNDFWNPRSMDTLLFNSYVGGACIFEWHNERIEVLRANDKYAKVIGGEKCTIEAALNLVWEDHMDQAAARETKAAIQRAIDTGEDAVYEACYTDLFTKGETWLRSTFRVVARTSDRFLLYASNENTTAQREAEQKERESNDRLRFLNETARDLLAEPEIDPAIERMLRKILNHFGGSRAYIIEMNYRTMTSCNTYEVCAPGVTSEKENLQSVSYEDSKFWWAAFDGDRYIDIADVSSLADDRAKEKHILEAQGVRSLVAVPLKRDGQLVGFVGVDDPTRQLGHVVQLRALGDYITVMLTRRDLTNRIQQDNETMRSLMDDTPGGFVRMRVFPDGHSVPIYVNSGFCEIVGMSAQEVIERYRESSLWGVHPDDLTLVQDTIAEMMKTGEARSTRYRLVRGDGSYVWVSIFGRMIQESAHETFFNVYYTDVSDQEKKELSEGRMLLLALSAMMEDSPEQMFVKDTALRYVKANRVHAAICNLQDPQELIGKTDYDMMERRFADKFTQMDRRVLETGRPVLNYMVSLPAENSRYRYAETSKYPLVDSLGNVIGIFGVSRDITEERTAYSRLKLLTDSIPGGIAMYEMTQDELRILYFSDGYFVHSGYTRAEYTALTGQDTLNPVLREDRPHMAEVMRSVLEGEDTFACTYRAYCKDGGFRWFHLRGTVLERHEDTVLFNAVKFDVTKARSADEALRIREEEYRLAIIQSGQSIYRYSHASNSIEMSDTTAGLFGLPAHMEHVPDTVIDAGVIAPDSIQNYKDFYAAIQRGEKTGSMTIRRQVTGGIWRWFTARFSTVYDDAGKPVSAIIMFQDVTEKREEAITEALDRNRFMAALAAIYQVIISVNLTKSTYQVINSSGQLYRSDEKEGPIDALVRAAASRMEPESADKFLKQFQTTALMQVFSDVGDSLRMEYRQKDGSGVMRWVEIVVLRTQNDYSSDVTGIIVCRFIDTQKAMEDKLKLADLDGMTGVYNKSVTEEMIARQLAVPNGGPCALLIADLDNLKSINDKLGHNQGDLAIKQMATLLRSHFRQTDVVGRIGGDEFAVFVDDIAATRINSIMVAFMRKLTTLRIGERRDVVLRGSIGIALGERGQDSYETLFKRADKALYHVKRNGKDDFAFYTPEMEESAYCYETHSATSRWQTSALDPAELDCLLKAVSMVYDLVISVNLTQNSYYMLQNLIFPARCHANAGEFDQLFSIGAETFHPEDREGFRKALCRQNLMEARKRGDVMVSYTGRQMGNDGTYRLIRTDAIFVDNPDSGDVMEITLAREVGSQ